MRQIVPENWLDNHCGFNVEVVHPVNVYGAMIGNNVRIGPFVEIQRGVRIGSNVKIGSHSFLCAGVVIGNGVLIGHGVMFCNDRHPRAINEDGTLKGPGDWLCEGVVVEDYASIGSGAVILPGVIIRRGAMVGAGAVVTREVEEGATVYGNPARRGKILGFR